MRLLGSKDNIVNLIKKHNILLATLIVIAIVPLSILLGINNNHTIPIYHSPHYVYSEHSSNPLAFTANWDGPIYIKIAKDGYGFFDSYNFFPLYPLLIYLVHLIIGSFITSALIISWLCLIVAIFFYFKLVTLLFDVKSISDKLASVMYLVLFPSGVFLLAAYTESMTIMLSLAAIYYALKNRYLLAGLFAMIGTATHITAIFVLPLIALILYEQKQGIIKSGLSAIIGSLGMVSYIVYLGIKFKKPFEFIKTQTKIHGWLSYDFPRLIHSADLLNVIFIILLMISAAYWYDIRKSFSFYSFLFIILPIVGGQFGGFNRYMLMAFPLQFMLFKFFKDKTKYYPYILALLSIGWTYFLLQYFAGYIGN